MDKLIQGVRQFQSSVHDEHQELFEQLAHGQEPETLFITCSDSRIDPNLITQTKPGDLFVIRNAGNLVAPYSDSPSAEAATIEYAINVLEVQHVIICGHAQCGAMDGLLSLDQLDSLPAVTAWLSHAEPTLKAIQKRHANLPRKELLAATVNMNVLVQLDHLRTHPAVSAAVEAEQLELHGWAYDFTTGEVMFYDPQIGEFLSLKN